MEVTSQNIENVWWTSMLEEIHQTLTIYKQTKIVKDYYRLTSSHIAGNTFVVTLHSRTLHFYCYRSTLSDDETMNVGNQTATSVTFRLKQDASVDDICLHMLEILEKRKNQNQKERFFRAKVHSRFKVRKASQLDDISQGIDWYITGSRNEMPIQIKGYSKTFWQHIEKYPNVPQLYCRPQHSHKQILRWVMEIYEAYHNGVILHMWMRKDNPIIVKRIVV